MTYSGEAEEEETTTYMSQQAHEQVVLLYPPVHSMLPTPNNRSDYRGTGFDAPNSPSESLRRVNMSYTRPTSFRTSPVSMLSLAGGSWQNETVNMLDERCWLDVH